MAGPSRNLKLVGYGVLVGLAYGLGLRLLLHWFPNNRFASVMSVAFVLVLPFCMGFIAVFLVEREQRRSVWLWLGIAVLPVVGGLLGSLLALWEGFICVVMFAPIGMICAVLGGLTGGLVARHTRNLSVVCVAMLPLLVNPWERSLFSKYEIRTVRTEVDIHASASTVWRNIERVSTITPVELAPSWSRRIGFPRPLDATLSNEGVGGVRHARFEGGVLFIETVDTWEPEHELGFSIRAQTIGIPPTTLDSHVTVGGPFFDVLHGEYSIETLPNGITRLHLRSKHRLSTDFNWYAHLWTDAVMADIQNSILLVVKHRCETEARQNTGGQRTKIGE